MKYYLYLIKDFKFLFRLNEISNFQNYSIRQIEKKKYN